MSGNYGPCVRPGCPHAAVRTVGSEALCAEHVEQLLAPIRERVFTQPNADGVGKLYGVLRPEYGPLVGDLRCTTCSATWTGRLGELCWWCQRSNEIQREHQAELVLRPPDIDPDDARYDNTMTAWAQRLAVAVRAGLVTEQQARRVWDRTNNRAA